MSRKKNLRELDAFSLVDQLPETSAAAIDSQLFGAIQSIDANRQSASPVNIVDILPDPRQPRRTIPHAVRARWSGRPEDLAEMFNTWVQLVREERGNTPFDIAQYLEAGEDIERPEQIGPLEEALLTLVELAVSIRQEGLTNPITVAPLGLKYQLETGERRWLSYHLLYLYTQDDRYSKIAARTVDQINIWRQAAENNARANLNAIGKARQFAVLLMDLLAQKRGDAFSPIDQFEREQLFYAQVADGDRYTVPRNSGERLLAAMGLKHTKQLRDYRALLKLPGVVWQIADDMNWTEYYIRSLREQAGDNPAKLITLAMAKARQAGYSVPVGALSEAQPVVRLPKARHEGEELVPGTRQYYTHLTRLMGKVGPGRMRANREALEVIQDFRRWLEEQEHLVKQYLGK